MDPYTICIINVTTYIRSGENQKAISQGTGVSAFDASVVLTIAFGKTKEEVIQDIIFCK